MGSSNELARLRLVLFLKLGRPATEGDGLSELRLRNGETTLPGTRDGINSGGHVEKLSGVAAEGVENDRMRGDVGI